MRFFRFSVGLNRLSSRMSSSSSTPALDFDKKVALVTGSTAGIGRATALQLLKQGAYVTLNGNDRKEAEETFQVLNEEGIPKDRFHYVEGDLEKKQIRETLVKETIDKFGKMDVLVNNVGSTGLKGQSDFFSMENLRHILEINVVCIADMTQLSVPHLLKTQGNVVNVSSSLASRPAFVGQWYSVSKAALEQYTRNAAALYAPVAIRVNAVRVGVVNTKLYEKYGYPALASRFISQTKAHSLMPGRTGEPDEIANVICFLANNKKASYVTGDVYGCDGGLTANAISPPADIMDHIKDLGYQSHGLCPPPSGNN